MNIRSMSMGILFPGLMNRKRLVCSLKVGAEYFDYELLVGYVNMRDVKNIEDHYYGDIDSEGKACGIGVIGNKNQSQKHEGTFFNNKIHGICKNSSEV